LWAVLSVETSGCGFLPDRRPKILFERHIFSRLTNAKYNADDPNISNQTQGGYGAGGSHQYVRLEAAMAFDADAALKSASWGLAQIMGENHAAAGFETVREMVDAMVASEDSQLRAMAHFVAASGMASALKKHDWARFARLYNGPHYAANNYDGLLQHFHAKFSDGPTPDLKVRAAQVYLTYGGFSPGAIDGVVGRSTTAAIKSFQKAAGLPQSGIVDDQLLQQLAA
jgi:hypothetical protein